MSQAAASLDTLARRFDHPSVRVLVRELSHLARDLERDTLAWPSAPLFAHGSALLPGLEPMEAALSPRLPARASAIDRDDWADFARTVQATIGAANDTNLPSDTGAPHPLAVIALRLIWGAERFAELPTVVLKPPPAAFLKQLGTLPAPAHDAPPEQLDHALAAWLQERTPAENQQARLPLADVRGFARVVAACRAVGHMRQALALEDVAAGYLAWVRLLRANHQQLTDVSSGWWSSNEGQPGRRPQQ